MNEQVNLGKISKEDHDFIQQVWSQFQTDTLALGHAKPKLSLAAKIFAVTLPAFTKWLTSSLGYSEHAKKEELETRREEFLDKAIKMIDDVLVPSLRKAAVDFVNRYAVEEYGSRT